MAEKIKVISADLDGAELRRAQCSNSYHRRCHGKNDSGEIQEALNHVGTMQFSIPGDRWETIFRSK